MNVRIRLAPLGMVALAACSSTPPVPGKAYDAGKDHLANGRSGQAIEAFRLALQEEHRSIRVLNALGASYDAIGRPELAEPYYREALIVAPDDVQTLNNLGYSLLLAGRADEAAALLAKAATVAPDDGVIGANLKMARERMGRSRPEEPKRSRQAAVTMPAGPWIERTSRVVQTLRTDPADMKAAVEAGVDPRLAVPAAPPEDLRPAPRAAVEVETLMPLPKALDAPIVPPPPPRPRAEATTPARLAGQCAIEVANGNGREGAAQRMGAWLGLGGRGHPVRLTNAATFSHSATVLHYAPSCAAQARALARTLPVPVDLRPDEGGRGVRLVLGRDLLSFDKTIGRDA